MSNVAFDCRVVLIQTDKAKNERNQRELTGDLKENNVQWNNEMSGENNLGMIPLRSFSKKDR